MQKNKWKYFQLVVLIKVPILFYNKFLPNRHRYMHIPGTRNTYPTKSSRSDNYDILVLFPNEVEYTKVVILKWLLYN
jgi:hypothetical protein